MVHESVDIGLAKDALSRMSSLARTPLLLAVNGKLISVIGVADTVRPESNRVLKALRQMGIRTLMISGDNKRTAQKIASELGIDEVYGEALPQDKARIIGELQAKGLKVAMVGDGLNDAPALKKATVGIAMGGIGSDIAVDAADIVLVNDEVKELPHLISLSKRMMTTIKLNLSFSMGLNFLAIVLAITGILNPVVGALVHNAGSVLVIINSALLLKWRKRK